MSFRYIEYTGPDSGDVLVSLLMNLAHPELVGHGGSGEMDTESQTELADKDEKVVGFVPNPSKQPEPEDEEEEVENE